MSNNAYYVPLVLVAITLRLPTPCGSKKTCVLPVPDPTALFGSVPESAPPPHELSRIPVSNYSRCLKKCCLHNKCNLLSYSPPTNTTDTTTTPSCVIYHCQQLPNCRITATAGVQIYANATFVRQLLTNHNTTSTATDSTSGGTSGTVSTQPTQQSPSTDTGEDDTKHGKTSSGGNKNGSDLSTAAANVSETSDAGNGGKASTLSKTPSAGTQKTPSTFSTSGVENSMTEVDTDTSRAQSTSKTSETSVDDDTTKSSTDLGSVNSTHGIQKGRNDRVDTSVLGSSSVTTEADNTSGSALNSTQLSTRTRPQTTDNVTSHSSATLTTDANFSDISPPLNHSTSSSNSNPSADGSDFTTSASGSSLSVLQNVTGLPKSGVTDTLPHTQDMTTPESQAGSMEGTLEPSSGISRSSQGNNLNFDSGSSTASPGGTQEKPDNTAVTDKHLDNRTSVEGSTDGSSQGSNPEGSSGQGSPAEGPNEGTPVSHSNITDGGQDHLLTEGKEANSSSIATPFRYALTDTAALIVTLSIGCFFFLVATVVLGKRLFESWKKRHYAKLEEDYLIDGMYDE